MSIHTHHEPESAARLNRVLAQARRSEEQRRRQLSNQELIATSRLELGLVGPRWLQQHAGRTYSQSQ
jgi:hypothetical protein